MKTVQLLSSAAVVCVGSLCAAQPAALDTFGPGDSFNPDLTYPVRGPDAPGTPVATAHRFIAQAGGPVTQIVTALRHVSGTNGYTLQLRLGDANHVGAVIGEWSGIQGGSVDSPLVTISAGGTTVLAAGESYWLALIAEGSATGAWHRNNQSMFGDWATSSNNGLTFLLVNGGLLPAARLTLEGDVPCPADWNDDGEITSADITAFLSVWFADLAGGTTNADFDNSGATTSADITAFLSAWFAALAGGC